MAIRVLGISGSPIKDGNVEAFLSRSLASAGGPGVTIESVSLSTLKVEDCRHCNFCLRSQKAGKYCALDDDGQELFEKVETSDVLVLASPVYFMRTSARMAAFVDRLRMYIFGNLTRGRLRNKVGVSLAVAGVRHAGLEMIHVTQMLAFGVLEMIPVTSHDSISPLGGSALSTMQGTGRLDRATRLGIEGDPHGLESGKVAIRRGLELAAIIGRGSVRGVGSI